MMKRFLALLLIQQALYGAEECFDSTLEALALQHVQQVTHPSMGFSKAGEAYFSPDGKSIIFQAVKGDGEHYQIYVMDLEERIPRMVSTGQGACTCGYFRPDGKKIIFASSHADPRLNDPDYQQEAPGYKREGGSYYWEFTPYMNIYEANPDGTELRALTTGPAYHAECGYSADGGDIVFASDSDGSMNIYTMKSDGSDIYQVTQTKQGYNGGTFFSPDSRRIVFRADYDTPHYMQIYVIDTDGKNLRQLTNNEAVNWAPYWHPNGEVIAYTTSIHGHAHYEIYLLNIETGASYRLTHNAAFDGLPVFSHNGKKILWTSKRGDDKTSQIFIADFTMPSGI